MTVTMPAAERVVIADARPERKAAHRRDEFDRGPDMIQTEAFAAEDAFVALGVQIGDCV